MTYAKASLKGGAFLVIGVLALAGCEAEREEVPEVAEIEAEPDEVGIELDEEFVIGPDDVGETFMINGWVAGRPLTGNGFFLLTEGNRRIFVETDQPAPPAGSPVRAIGTMAAADAMVFEGWETEAFEGEMEAEWDLERGYFLDARTVEPLSPGILPETPPSETGATEDDTLPGTGDTVSGRG